MNNYFLTALIGSIAFAADLKASNAYPAEITLAEVSAQIEAGCPGDDHHGSGCCHNHCGGCCHNHCGSCCHDHCDSDPDTDPEPEPCDTSGENCNTPDFCYNVTGWSVAEVLSKHDINQSGCLDFCEFQWFSNCNFLVQGWP